MRIVCLCENTTNTAGVGCEHGLSIYIEANGTKLLFDMGQSDLFARNAELLGVDLSAVETAVLSHGHYDHGGGLTCFLEINKIAPVFVNPGVFGEYYNGVGKYIGIDPALRGNPRFVNSFDGMDIGNGIRLFHSLGRTKPYAFGSYGLTCKMGDVFYPDSFLHEQYLQIEEGEKKVIFSGCSHNGVANITNWFSPNVLVGGFHFSKITDKTELKSKALQMDGECDYFTCHCTGTDQYTELKGVLPKLKYLSCGCDIEV